ncbi:flagellar protein FlaG [Paenibacillus humicola]|uniref:flagellar protein FlaG n=1 Tax=Paenibacillus humicola TaxID=3110540 RepID=UPI00237AC280|nr:flagellar protein FlaG [Paenibacillus humicola]
MEVQPASEKTLSFEQPGVRKRAEQEREPVEDRQQHSYSKADIAKEIGHLNKMLESKDSHLHFVLHDKLNEYYVQVVDDSTNEVIKEIPSKKVMDMVAGFYETLGIIVDKKI